MRAIVSALLLLIVIVPSALFAQVHELPTAANMKVLGLVGGTSWHSTVEYYRSWSRTFARGGSASAECEVTSGWNFSCSAASVRRSKPVPTFPT